MVGADLIGHALVALRYALSLADKKKLPDAELGHAVAACRGVALTAVPYSQALLTETRWRESVVASLFGAAPSAFDAEAQQAARADIDAAGGVAALAGRYTEQRAVAAGLDAAPVKPGNARLAYLGGERTRIWGEPGHASLDAHAYARWELLRAELEGTCLIAALELDRRKRGKLAPTLDALVPKVLDAAPVDPIALGPWELVADGLGGAVLRSGPMAFPGNIQRVELPIPPRK